MSFNYRIKKKSILFLSSILFFGFLFSANKANATEHAFSWQTTGTSNYLYYADGWRYAGQYLPNVAVSNLSSIAYTVRIAIPEEQTIRVCKGTPAPTDYADWIANAPTCNYPDNELVYSTTTTPQVSTGQFLVKFHSPVPLDIGEDYYIVLDVLNTDHQELEYCAGCGTGLILGPGFEGAGSLVYTAYYDDEYVATVAYLYDITSGYYMPDGFSCCEGYECVINGGQAALRGDTNYTIYSGKCASWPWLMTKDIASGTMPAYTGTWSEDIATSTGSWPLCYTSERIVLSGVTEYHYIIVNDFELLMQPATSTYCMSLELPDTWCNNPCSGIATTTFGGDIQCGLQAAAAWAVCVSSSSLSSLTSSAQMLRTKFPFSAPFSLIDQIKIGLGEYSTTTQGFSMPMISAATTSMQMIQVLDASSTERVIGRTNAILWRRVLGWAGYIFFVAIFALIIWPKKKV